MAHRTSASALHTARVVLKNYALTVRPPEELPSGRVPNLRADEACLAVVIDYATNVFQISTLRPELFYWQEHLNAGTATAPQLLGYMTRLSEAFDMLPKSKDEDKTTTTLEGPKEFAGSSQVIRLSKPALEASRFIFFYYAVAPKSGAADDVLDRIKVAKLVEVSLGLRRACEAVPILHAWKEQLKKGNATEKEIRRCFREVGALLAGIPSYENREEETKLLI